jgi:hypothetical protein
MRYASATNARGRRFSTITPTYPHNSPQLSTVYTFRVYVQSPEVLSATLVSCSGWVDLTRLGLYCRQAAPNG